MAESEFFRVETQDHIATITISRAEKRNALTADMLVGLRQIAEDLRGRDSVRAVILRGDGTEFSVGADISQMGGEKPSLTVQRHNAENGALLMRALREIHQPTICLLRGIATGGGACIASACDFRIATPNARIGYGEAKLGMNLMWHALPLAIQLIGLPRAKRMVMTGALFDAKTMRDWGFVDEIVADDAIEEHVLGLAREYANMPPVAVQMIKRSANAYADALSHSVMHADADQWLLATQSEDFKEGVSAFREKRKPDFRGN